MIPMETFLVQLEDFMSPCSRQIPPGAKCGPDLRAPANQEMQRTIIVAGLGETKLGALLCARGL